MISIIIPTLNEETALPAALASIFRQSGDYEIIVVDGGSSDNTRSIIKQHERCQLLSTKTGRAVQMNAGAAIARGDWLLFLHADAQLPTAALDNITSLDSNIQAGGFKHRFTGVAWGLKLVSWLHNFRCKCTNVFYGDQATFIRRELFEKLGGYPDEACIEDLLFAERLRKHTKPVLLDDYVLSDSRKFEQKGIWLSLWRVIVIQIRHELGLPVKTEKFFANVR